MTLVLPDAVKPDLGGASLSDKYTLQFGRAFMSGVQALVRLPMMQRQRDAMAGLNTAGFISGYRGSPLGGYDQALVAARAHLEREHIVFQPGVNEELAATAVWGTQQLDLYPQTKKYDGVFGIWYGKGPGVDRSSDVFKHANLAGTARYGGVVAVAGDDHISKSSTAAHQSDHIFKACGLPVFFPSDVQGILDMGLHAIALSRFSGVWAGMKTIQEVVESSSSVLVDPTRVKIVMPEDFQMPPGGVHIRWPDPALDQEARLMDHKWYAALAYVRANKLNHNVIASAHDRFGIIASGKAFNDTRQALHDLGLDDSTCQRLGIRLHKVNVVWPLEATITRDFAQGLQEILVVEEKRQVIEYQLKEELYNWRAAVRPAVVGKFGDDHTDDGGGEWSHPNPSGNWLLRAKADLSPALVAKAIAQRLKKLGVPDNVAARMDKYLDLLAAKERGALTVTTGTGERTPWFCSGCPHNTSTRVPEGSRALAGIGCHFMSVWMDRSTSTFSQMGGEGVAWVGQQPFTTDTHVFANLGDGTYFHSGLLAVRQSIAAGVNITYKILYNDAVAMTGGQRVGERAEGHSVLQIMASLTSEGVSKLVIVTDEPQKYAAAPLLPGVEVLHRDELDRIQREFREIKGTTAIIYDQMCATEKRRKRKRGSLTEPDERIVINELVCEGCGDCGEQSNCLSIEPLETEFGRKRRINQSACNKDVSCVKGFCPSFVTVKGGQLKKPKSDRQDRLGALPDLPQPALPQTDTAWGIVVGGVGGTGVITIGQLLGMAAHLEGKGVVTQDAGGLAQKGGATWSHIQIANSPELIYTSKVDVAKADLVIGCDAIVAASKATLAVMQLGRTFVALNTHATPTAAFVHDTQWQFPAGGCEAALAAAVGTERLGALDAEHIAVAALGDSIYTNPLLLGYAWQKGRVPLSHAALMRAMDLNGVQVQNNQLAFEWGRHCAHHLDQVQAALQVQQVIKLVKKPSVAEVLAKRVAYLNAYQNAAYAQRYQALVLQVQEVESAWGKTRLTEAVAHNLFKLMAYKDEYEVARLYSDGSFAQKIAAEFEGDVQLHFHLAPPLLAKTNVQGHLVKQRFGPWMMVAYKQLAKLKVLRGTWLDPFGQTSERKQERALIDKYQNQIQEILKILASSPFEISDGSYQKSIELASLPQDIRGFGHVKAGHIRQAMEKWHCLASELVQLGGQSGSDKRPAP
ncbi:MAG: indolepyruvate ferredoxin oxidoreductase family protein [Rhodoferax sp.]|nr:indolepyruvate ferredoxin oxidoreductase family protein [Rhodoferax sp.]